jgi:hypothetical protein
MFEPVIAKDPVLIFPAFNANEEVAEKDELAACEEDIANEDVKVLIILPNTEILPDTLKEPVTLVIPINEFEPVVIKLPLIVNVSAFEENKVPEEPLTVNEPDIVWLPL